MALSRRQFLLGSAAGLVLPSFYDKAFSYFENHDEPLLIAPKQSDRVLYACPKMADGFELVLGDPAEEPPTMTIREFCQAYGSGDPETWWRQEWLIDGEAAAVDMDSEMDPWDVQTWWGRRDSPEARAYHYLQDLDLGPELRGLQVVGRLDFIDGPCPGSSYLGVETSDTVTLSLLQQRLNELGSRIAVRLASSPWY